MMRRTKNLPDTRTFVNEHLKVKENSIYYAKETNDEFSARIKEKTAKQLGGNPGNVKTDDVVLELEDKNLWIIILNRQKNKK